jgi:RNA-directed DNA polymerase
MLNIQMKSARQKECDESNSLFAAGESVWFECNGKVNPLWLSVCKEQRHRTSNLMEQIAEPLNLIEACKKVIVNGGSCGVDKMQVNELGLWLQHNLEYLRSSLLQNNYKPHVVRSVQIPKPKGGYRQLGIPTVIDRLVQQAISQVLTSLYDPTFSVTSYGFRPNRNAHQALKQGANYVKEGKRLVVDIDLAQFFDEVNHHRLLWLLGTRLSDKRVLDLVNRFLQSGILRDGLIEQRTKGTPQGSPLSPLLSNIVLDELDQELNRRGLSYVRYADDMQVFVRSQKSAERVMNSVTKFIEERMKLKVNRSKSAIRKHYECNFLGHSFLNKGSVGLSNSSELRLKSKLKQVTQRKRGVSLESVIHQLRPLLQGWLNYFKYANMQSKLSSIDGWLRRRLKCFRLKQCKRCISIVRFLRNLGVDEKLSWKTGLSGKGWWRLSTSPALSIGMNNEWFTQQGYYSLGENYKRLHRNIL